MNALEKQVYIYSLGTESFFAIDPCKVCKGARLRPEALHVFLGDKINIVEVTEMSIQKAYDFFEALDLSKKDQEKLAPIN